MQSAAEMPAPITMSGLNFELKTFNFKLDFVVCNKIDPSSPRPKR